MNNAATTPAQNIKIHFNETQWLQSLFLLAERSSPPSGVMPPQQDL